MVKRQERHEAMKTDVADKMKRLQGSSRNDLVGDRDRGASSSLGMGSKVKEKR